ncbi:MAG: twin-arginine translocase TatA/TatE family subunit [Eggerthellaceae bacterium]|nr:twin-arginine translocase TatA/TatE family subunit [Eggerthellaceae bacterium]
MILLFGFLIFGPDKLPAIAKTVAQALNKFKSAQEEMTKVIKTEVYDPTSDEPFKNPLDVLTKIGNSDKPVEKTESFTERKAKYDKERAAKKAAEERKLAAAKPVTAAAVTKAVTDASKDELPKGEAAPGSTPSKPKLSADELYGNKPVAKAAAGNGQAVGKPGEGTAKPAEKAAQPASAKPAASAGTVKPTVKLATSAKPAAANPSGSSNGAAPAAAATTTPSTEAKEA